MDYILQSAANYGFPMVVAVYLLVRVDRRIAELDISIKSLTNVIERQKILH